jgi:hypothetical protein
MIATALVNGDYDRGSSGSQSDGASETEWDISVEPERVGSNESMSDEASTAANSAALRRYYDEIVNIVDNLFAVSILIRGTSPMFQASRAAAHVERDSEGNDILAEFKSIVGLRITALYPATPTWLVQRLQNLIGIRRQQFYYQRAHNRRLARIPTTFRDDDVRVVSDSPGVYVREEYESATRKTTRSRPTVQTTETAATELILEIEQLTAPVPGKATLSEKRLGENLFPASPRGLVGKDFECNQCFYILPNETRLKEASWRLGPRFSSLISGSTSFPTSGHTHVRLNLARTPTSFLKLGRSGSSTSCNTTITNGCVIQLTTKTRPSKCFRRSETSATIYFWSTSTSSKSRN